MVKGKEYIRDCRNGSLSIADCDYPDEPPIDFSKGLDAEKLKSVLLSKGIVADKSEVE